MCDAAGADLQTQVQAGFDAFLSLAPVTEPDPHHLLFQVQSFGDPGNFLRRGFTLLYKTTLQSLLSSQAYSCPSLPLSFIHSHFVIVQSTSQLCLVQPLLQDGLEFACVFEAELKVLEAADCGLTEFRSVDSSQGLSHVGLGVAKLDPPDFKVIGEHLQLADLWGVHGGGVVLLADALPRDVGLRLPRSPHGRRDPQRLIRGEQCWRQSGEAVAQSARSTAQAVIWKLVQARGQRAWGDTQRERMSWCEVTQEEQCQRERTLFSCEISLII